MSTEAERSASKKDLEEARERASQARLVFHMKLDYCRPSLQYTTNVLLLSTILLNQSHHSTPMLTRIR